MKQFRNKETDPKQFSVMIKQKLTEVQEQKRFTLSSAESSGFP